MDLTQPKPIEERVRELYADARIEDGASHEQAIVDALLDVVQIGHDDAHLARGARTLASIAEEDFNEDVESMSDQMDESEAAYRRDVEGTGWLPAERGTTGVNPIAPLGA